MANKIIYLLFVLIVILTYSSCKKDPDPMDEEPVPNKGSLILEFDNVVGTKDLVLNDSLYLNQNGDTFNVTKFKYYISNVKLYTSSGSHYDVPDSYYLIDESVPGSSQVTINNIPNDTYTSIEFMIGVDSIRNVSGVQSGALDPGNNMFWSWSSGYIMLKLEGVSPQSPATQNAILFHVGGFSGVNSVLKTITPDLGGNSILIKSTSTPKIHFITDILEMFDTPTAIDFSVFYGIHSEGTNAKIMADNYEDMITFDHIH